jgi:biotin carboxylase
MSDERSPGIPIMRSSIIRSSDHRSMKRILLVAATTGYQIRSFGDAAEALGVRLVFASDRCDQLDDPWWDQAIPVKFHDEAAARRAVDGLRVDGILAVGDRPAVLAAALAEALGLPGNPPAAARASRNKEESRAAFQAAGLPTPPFVTVSLDDDARRVAATLTFPVVLKPLALSGSRGVMRVDDAASFVSAFERLRAILATADVRLERDALHCRALIEAFVPGREFAIEGLLTQGAFRALAIFDKPDPLDGPFFEETIYVTPSRVGDGTQAEIVEAVRRAASALGLRHGPVHAECRVNEGGVHVLEVAPRPIGGLCSRALRFVDGGGASLSLEEVLVRHALGEDVSAYARETRASGVMMIPIPRRGIYRGVTGEDAAARVAGVEEVRMTAKPDALLLPLPEGRSYLGFIFARGDDAAGVEHALRDAHARLDFTIDREIVLRGPA